VGGRRSEEGKEMMSKRKRENDEESIRPSILHGPRQKWRIKYCTNEKKICLAPISSFQEVPLNQSEWCQLSSAEQTQLVEPLFWGGLACLRLDIGQTFACGTARIDQVSNDQ
jgi:hypothetical protein